MSFLLLFPGNSLIVYIKSCLMCHFHALKRLYLPSFCYYSLLLCFGSFIAYSIIVMIKQTQIWLWSFWGWWCINENLIKEQRFIQRDKLHFYFLFSICSWLGFDSKDKVQLFFKVWLVTYLMFKTNSSYSQ